MPSTLDLPVEDYPTFPARAPIEIQEDGTDFDSTNVHSLLYDFGAESPGEQELVARFYRDGADAVYQYPGFPASEWQGLAEASSKGRYINLNVKGVYGFNRLRISRFPQQGHGVAHPVARRFLTQGITTNPNASHPHR